MIGINKELVRKHFNRHAQEYDRYAAIQNLMGEKLLEAVREERGERPFARILEIGCGTGNFTRMLLEAYPDAHYTAIDLSESMIAKAKEKLGKAAERVVFVAADAETAAERIFGAGGSGETVSGKAGSPDAAFGRHSFDLIVSNATFQWFNTPRQTVRSFLRLLEGGGILAFSTFGPQTFRELHESFQAAECELGLPRMRHGQPFCGGEEWRAAFAESGTGFRRDEESRCHEAFLRDGKLHRDGKFYWNEEVCAETYPSVRHFLHSVKRIGAGNASAEQSAYAGKKLFAAMERHYRERFGSSEGIRATYHLGFGVFRNGK